MNLVPGWFPAGALIGGVFPEVAATNTGGSSELTSSYNVPLPSGLVSGDLLLMFISTLTDSTISNYNGMTSLYEVLNPGDGKAYCLHKTATGSEGGTLQITMASGELWGTVTYRISKDTWQGVPEDATTYGDSSATADPPSLIPSWGVKKTLWLATAHTQYGVPTSAPSGFSSLVLGQNSSGNCGCGVAHLQSQVASLNPGTMTLDGTRDWVAATVAVRGN